ncbi:MAG: hypothetical protein HGA45_02870 [Chloroflexales bacterium]|nr:hypothetical protein [Chloroflexales bacterium]
MQVPTSMALPASQRADKVLRYLVGLTAIIVPLLYILSDAVEVVQGGHSQASLALTYLGEAPTVFFILGLHVVQRPRAGWLGLSGAILYGYAFIFWAGFTLHGLFTHASDLPAMAASVGALYDVHAVIQVVGGALIGWSVLRAGVLPRWTGVLLMLGMLAHVALSPLGLSESYRWIASTTQNLAFVGMGLAVVFGVRAGARAPGAATWCG